MFFTHSKSLLLILAVVLAWFSPWIIGGKILAPLDLQNRMMSPWRAGNETVFAKNHIVSDGVDQYLVYRMIAEKNYREEGWVGWSSLTYGGTAQHANTMALYYDWTMQLHRWFDFWTAWHLGLMGQVLLAAYGMYYFLRGRSINHVLACCGALAYAANSQFITWIYHRWTLSAFCWVPWILWAIDAHRRGKRFAWQLVPVFIGMAFLGGTLQHAALVVLAVAAIWLEEAIQTETVASLCERRCSPGGNISDAHRAPLQLNCFRNRPTIAVLAYQSHLIGRYALWGLLGLGLAAMMFLPCTDALLISNSLGLHTGMTANVANSIYPQGPLQPLFNLAAYPFQIFPSILGRCGSVDVLKLFRSELFYVAYFGSLPVLVAYLAFWRKDSPLLARILIGCGLLLPLTPLVRVLYQRLYLLFILGGILAFTHFMENATRETRLRVFKITGSLAALAVTGWFGISLLLHSQPGITVKIRDKIAASGGGSSFGFFSEWISQRANHFISDLFIWSPQQWIPLVLFAVALAGLYWTASSHEKRRSAGTWLVTLAVIGEVSLFGSRWVTWSDPTKDPLFAETPESRALHEHVGHDGRVTTLIHPTAHMARTPFIPNTLSAYGIAADNGYDSIIPKGMLLPGESAGDASKLGRFAVSHLITWTGNPDVPKEWKPVWNSPSMSLYENTRPVPRYLAFKSQIEMDSFFAGEQPEYLFVSEKTGKENSRSLDVPAGARWIRIAENQGDGWQYRGSGTHDTWNDVMRAPDASMIMENPTPDQPAAIEMRYNPPLRRSGMWISFASLLLIVASSIRRTPWVGRARRGKPCFPR